MAYNQKHEEYLRRIRSLRLIDDNFMTMVFDGNIEATELVLRIVLDRDDLQVKEVKAQQEIKNPEGRSVRLDVFAVDAAGKAYDIEVQRDDRGAVPQRARYNSSMMDAGLAEPNSQLKDLPDSYVIFITEHDVLGYGKPLYTVERIIKEVAQPFADGTHILFVNGACRADTPLGRLMQDFFCTDPAQMHYPALARRTKYFKEETEGVEYMCKVFEDLKQEGRAEGRAEGRMRTAEMMLAKGKYTIEEIAELTELPVEAVRKLAAAKGEAAE